MAPVSCFAGLVPIAALGGEVIICHCDMFACDKRCLRLKCARIEQQFKMAPGLTCYQVATRTGQQVDYSD